MEKRKLMVLFIGAVLSGLLLAACGGVANEWIGGENASAVQVGPFQVLTTELTLFDAPQTEAAARADWVMVKEVVSTQALGQVEAESQIKQGCPFSGHE